MEGERNDRWFQRPGIWFWVAIAIGAALRFYLVVFTEGTKDVEIWGDHADNVHELGLIGYYRYDFGANHPPLISYVQSLLYRASEATGLPYRILLRAPFALLDAGTTFLLVALLGAIRYCWLLAAAYWLHPLAIIFSAYHGNTDSSIPFFLLLCIWLLSRENLMGAAAVAGASLWIKLPGILAFPALVLLINGWRRRLIFLGVAGATAIATYLPAIIQDARTVMTAIFGYHGEPLHTTGFVPVWGPKVLLFSFIALPDKWPESSHGPILFFLNHSWQLAVALVLLLVWLRRARQSVPEVCATVGMLYVVIYGFSDNWAFQYFAWSIPFWFFLRRWFLVTATALGTGYIYSLYWLLCGNPWLLGKWDFVGHPNWPWPVLLFRNLAVLFFFTSACIFLASSLYKRTAAETAAVLG